MTKRILVTIPHFHSADPARGRHGSCTQTAAERAGVLRQCIAALWETFAAVQCEFDLARPRARAVNGATACDVHVIVCTAGDRHALCELTEMTPYFEHRATDAPPPMLGYECHRAMADRVDAYDYYVYLEDDLVVGDPAFFLKQDAFREQFGEDAILSPNRFERRRTFPLVKAYIDGPLAARFSRAIPRHPAARQRLLEGFGPPVTLRIAGNPHAGCFVLSRVQMSRWQRQRHFLKRDANFVSALESAATLAVARTFAVYKPAPRWASFLEIEHVAAAYIDRLTQRGPGTEERAIASDESR